MKRALLLHGGWPGHSPHEFARIARELMRADFEVDETQDPYCLAGDLTVYDLIVPIWTQALLTEGLTFEQERGLLGAVERGTGLAGWHGLTASWRASQAFQFLIGGCFVAHPGDMVRYEVNIADRYDPITAGLEDFALTSEQYYMHVDPGNEVLATTRFSGEYLPWIANNIVPVAWKKKWGNGRVFYSAIGHAPEEFDIPQVREIVWRGLRWAAR